MNQYLNFTIKEMNFLFTLQLNDVLAFPQLILVLILSLNTRSDLPRTAAVTILPIMFFTTYIN